MPEFGSFWQWLGWLIILTVTLTFIDSMWANWCLTRKSK